MRGTLARVGWNDLLGAVCTKTTLPLLSKLVKQKLQSQHFQELH